MDRTPRTTLSPSSRLVSGRTSLHFPGSFSGSTRLRHSDLTARGILATRRQELSNAIVCNAHGFPYSRKLETHKSCVNALTFSSGDGRFLASGGDDLQVCLWDFHQEDVMTPSYKLNGPKGNIFCLEFSTTNRYLYAAGTCEVVYKYDITYLGSSSLPLPSGGGRLPDTLYADNDDSIRAVAGHITQDEIFMTASEDGTIRRYDGRENTRVPRAQNVIQTSNEITDVKYHPTMQHLFLSSNGAGEVNLFDDRMAFTSSFNKSDDGIVQKYNTKITKRLATRFCHPEASNISFDRDGSKFAVSFMQYLPTIYSVSDPDPIAVLSGNNLPDGTPNPPGKRTYSNVCTMKHGSFGGPGLDVDDMYAAGSDDFRCYVWKIPPVSQLLNQREIISADDWNASERLETAFSVGRNEPRAVPVEIATPLCRLTGHDSIVNTAVFHPHLFHIVTSGVEKNIILHSPTPSSPCTQNLQRSPADVRELKPEDEDLDRANYLTALFGSHPTLLTESADDREERRTFSLFDHILREEGDADVWTRRPWSMPGSDDDNEQEDEGSSDSASDDSDMDEIAFLPSFLT